MQSKFPTTLPANDFLIEQGTTDVTFFCHEEVLFKWERRRLSRLEGSGSGCLRPKCLVSEAVSSAVSFLWGRYAERQNCRSACILSSDDYGSFFHSLLLGASLPTWSQCFKNTHMNSSLWGSALLRRVLLSSEYAFY